MSISVNNESLEGPVEPVKSTSALTSYAESAPSIGVVETSSDAKLDSISNPYEPQDMKKVLERSYLVDQTTWSATEIAGAPLMITMFPDTLLNIENIQDKLAQFEFLKSDVEVEVKVNATPFHIGSLNLSWLSHASADAGLDSNQRLNMNSTVMSVSSVNSVKIQIPRTGPNLWDRVHYQSDPLALTKGSIGTLWIDVLDPLRTLSGEVPSPLRITIFANFKNPRVAGYGVSDVSPLNLKRKAKRLALQGENRKKSLEEGKKKSEKGLISGIAEAAGSMAPLMAASPLAEFAPIAMAAGAFAPFLASLGLCKPNDVSATVKQVVKPYEDMPYCHGLNYGTKMSARPEAQLADTDMSFLKRNKIHDLVKRPCHILQTTLNGSTATGTPFLHFPVTPGLSKWNGTLFTPTWMSLLAKFFTKWRGSLKFMLRFVTSQYTTARVRIMHLPNDNIPVDVEGFSGDIPNTVVDVRGNTDYCFSVPYLSNKPYLPVPGFHGPQQTTDVGFAVTFPTTFLSVSLVNPVNIPDPTGDSTIYMHLYVGAGDDFQLGELVGWSNRQDATPGPPLKKEPRKIKEEGVIKKKSLEEIFSKPFRPLIPATGSAEVGLVLPEKVTTIEEILKRPRPDMGSATYTSLPFYASPGLYNENSTMSQLLWVFQFYRGGLRYKIMRETPAICRKWFGTSGAGENSSEIIVAAGALAPFDIECPWDSDSFVRPLVTSCPQDGENVAWSRVALPASTAKALIYISVAEDFQLGGPLAPWSVLPFNGVPPAEDEEKTDLSESVSSSYFTNLIKVSVKD